MDLARKIVSAEVGDPGSAEQVAAAAMRICERLTRYLAGIVGQGGIRTLLNRSLTLTRADYPWIAGVDTSSDASRWAALHDCLAEQDAATALEAFTMFLGAFVALFGRLIGDALVARLLHDIWPEVFGPKERT
jgi:hypothetical protein